MKLIVCMPGKVYSGQFLECWTAFLAGAIADGIEVSLSRKYSPNIYLSRNLCLLSDLRKGRDQLPFNGDSYDWILWIDSDMIFSYGHFKALLARDKDIIAAHYAMENGDLALVREWDSTLLAKEGKMKFSKPEDFTDKTEPVMVSYVGMGFFLMRKGVLEKIKFPFFKTLTANIGTSEELMTEDVSFCLEAQSNGFSIFVDPLVRVGHEKTKIL